MQVSSKELISAKESLQRCLKSEKFLDRFYDLFLSSSDEVKDKFKNTGFTHQKIMLKASLHIILMLANGKLKDTETLKNLAERHSRRDLNIKPEYYDNWLECMIKAASESDPKFGVETEQAWRHALKPGVDFLKSHY